MLALTVPSMYCKIWVIRCENGYVSLLGKLEKKMIFVIVPAYNEEANLSALISKVAKVFIEANKDYKILIINDGSIDRTKNICTNLAKKYPIQILNHPVNMGIGAVFNTGLKSACNQSRDNDIILLLEGDGTNDPTLIPDMAKKISNENYDIIIGSRYQKGGGYHRFPLKRLILSKGANYIIRMLFPIKKVKDYTIFFRAYRAEMLQKGFRLYGEKFIEAKSFLCNAEILVKLRSLKPKVEEIPMVYRYDLRKGNSKMNIKVTFKEYLYFIFNILRRNLFRKRTNL